MRTGLSLDYGCLSQEWEVTGSLGTGELPIAVHDPLVNGRRKVGTDSIGPLSSLYCSHPPCAHFRSPRNFLLNYRSSGHCSDSWFTHAGPLSSALFCLWEGPQYLGPASSCLSLPLQPGELGRFCCINFRLCVNTKLGSLERSVLQPKLSVRNELPSRSGDLGPGTQFLLLSTHCQPGKTRSCWGRGWDAE